MPVFYHYTTTNSALSIYQSGVIRKSTKKARRRDDARYGVGVYLTKLDPSKTKGQIAWNNYDGSEAAVRRAIGKGKVDAFIRLVLSSRDVVECDDEDGLGRDIWLYPDNDLYLEDVENVQIGVVAD